MSLPAVSAALCASLLLAACNDSKAPSELDASGAERKKPEQPSDKRVVRISPEAIARSGIRVDTVIAAPAAGGIEVPAEVQAEPDRQADVASIAPGQVARVSASVGDRVEPGQTLAVIRSVALGEARAAAARARANVDVAESNFRRQEELRREGIGAERNYLEAEAALKRARAEQSAAERTLEVYGRGGSGSEVRIKSPIAGRVVRRQATVGEVVEPGHVLFEVVDIRQVWVVGRVYQRHAGSIREGAPSLLTVQALPGRTFAAPLDYVAPALDERTRTLPVRLTLDNPDGVLLPGMFGSLSISPADTTGNTLPAVAAGALQRLGEETVVFVPAGAEGEFRAVAVTIAGHGGEQVRLRSGLSVGDRYVADGAFVLKSELSRREQGEDPAH